MDETIRPKMHIWGPDKTQRVIFVDEFPAWAARGWREHPSKVGQPLEVKPMPVEMESAKPEPEVATETTETEKEVNAPPVKGKPKKTNARKR